MSEEVIVEDKMVVYDDPIWEFVVRQRLQKYVEPVRKWWQNVENLKIESTGVFSLTDNPPGLMYRVTKCASKSPIKGVQAFPFVPSAYLQISGVAGGSVKMMERVCMGGLQLEEFTIIEKHNLPSTYNQGQIICFVPTEIYQNSKQMGRFVYFTIAELEALGQGIISKSVQSKVEKHRIVI